MNQVNGIERIDSDTQELVGRITFDRVSKFWERRTVTYPFGASVVVEHAAQYLRHSDPAVCAMLMTHAKTLTGR
jgi:hypothetical protein